MARLSPAARERLVDELGELDRVLLPRARRLVEEAKAAGDMSQNPDYFVAAEEEAALNGRRAHVMSALTADQSRSADVDFDGSVVEGSVVVLDFGDGPEEFVFGSIEEQFDGVTVISPSSPVGQVIVALSPGASAKLPTGGLVVVRDVRPRV